MFRCGVDFSGPLLFTKCGNRCVLVGIEHCTKRVDLMHFSTRHPSINVARVFIENILSVYGVPGVVLKDQVTEFQGEF